MFLDYSFQALLFKLNDWFLACKPVLKNIWRILHQNKSSTSQFDWLCLSKLGELSTFFFKFKCPKLPAIQYAFLITHYRQFLSSYMADFWYVSLSLLIFDGFSIERFYRLPILMHYVFQNFGSRQLLILNLSVLSYRQFSAHF